jgi:hypothetical protein
LTYLRLSPDEVVLVVDLGDLRGGDEIRDLHFVRAALYALPAIEAWRSVAVAGASFPEDLSDFEGASISTAPRVEWALWTKMAARPDRLHGRRIPIFADYAISHPLTREMDPRVMRMSASIRYTIETSWLVAKGRNVKDHGYDQYRALARKLVERSDFCGADFSWGDQFIFACAHNQAGPGNATTWRKVGTNHHLTFVARQLSNLALLSAAS